MAVGAILVGCCPGGTSSNIMKCLSKGYTALSVSIVQIVLVLILLGLIVKAGVKAILLFGEIGVAIVTTVVSVN